MFKPLERNVAIVVTDDEIFKSGSWLAKSVTKHSAIGKVFGVSQVAQIDTDRFEAIILSEFDRSALGAAEAKPLAKTLKLFHAQSKPIGAIGQSVRLVAELFASAGAEVTVGENPSLALEILAFGARHTPCPESDYLSDRDNKLLTTPGSFARPDRPDASRDGIQKLLRELIEMA